MKSHLAFLHPDKRFFTRIFFAVMLPLVLGTLPAAAQNSKGNWLVGSTADQFWEQVGQSPYTQNGNHGMVIYMLSYSHCANCIEFLRDFWEQRKGNMQLREIFVPISQPKLLDEAADMALTRNPAFADAYYHQRRVAPTVNGSPERQAALNHVEQFTTLANQFFRKIGHIQDGYPTFIFRVKDEQGRNKLWIISGWGPEIARDMDGWVKQYADTAVNYPGVAGPPDSARLQDAIKKGAGQ
jgi:hypothetical protein